MSRFIVQIALVITALFSVSCATSKISISGTIPPDNGNPCIGFINDDPLSEALSTELMGYGFKIVERSRLKEVLGEQSFTMSGIVIQDVSERSERAGIHGVDYLVMVKVTPCDAFPDRAQSATVKFVDFRNGNILLAVNYTNGSGGAPGSPADSNMKDRIPETAEKIATEIAKKFKKMPI